MTTPLDNTTNILPPSGSIMDDLNAAQARRSMPAIIYIATLMVPGVIGNALTIYIYLRILPKSSTKRLFILVLAVFDFLECAILMPAAITALFTRYKFVSDIMCKLMRAAFYYIASASVLTLMLIALERYRKICHPLKWQITTKMAQRYVCVGGIVALVLSLPAPVMHGATRIATPMENVSGVGCHVTEQFRQTVYPTAYSATILTGMFVCLIYLVVCYSLIHKQCRRHLQFPTVHMSTISQKPCTQSNRDTDTSTTNNDNCLSARHIQHGCRHTKMMKVTRMMFVVTSVFVLSFIPHCCLEIVATMKTEFVRSLNDEEFGVYEIALRSNMVNHMANPIIYGFLDNAYRHACKLLLPAKLFG